MAPAWHPAPTRCMAPAWRLLLPAIHLLPAVYPAEGEVLLYLLEAVEGGYRFLEVLGVVRVVCRVPCAVKAVCRQSCVPSRLRAVKVMCRQGCMPSKAVYHLAVCRQRVCRQNCVPSRCVPSRCVPPSPCAVNVCAINVCTVKVGSGFCHQGGVSSRWILGSVIKVGAGFPGGGQGWVCFMPWGQ
jgi:hypothetical protein